MSEVNMGMLAEERLEYLTAFRASDITSAAMRAAIPEWLRLYYESAPTEREDPCQRIAYTVVRKLTKTVFSEYQATAKDPFGAKVLEAIGNQKMEGMQMALIGGESFLKPIPSPDSFRFMVVPRHNVLIFGRDAEGRLTDLGLVEKSTYFNSYYTLLERRTLDGRGYLTIRNSLYRSYVPGSLGRHVPLNSLEQYAQLPEEYTFPQPVHSVGLAPVRTPMANCVDGSRDAVSVYAAAVGLIHNIDRNEAQINGEFARGESRVLVSDDLLEKSKPGEGKIRDHLFVGLDEDPADLGITIFSPQLREQSFLARKQEYLRNVENVIGLKRGLLSEVEAAERTATEITSSAGEYNLTIVDFQRMWENAVKEALRLCGVLGQMYRIPGAHEIAPDEISILWGNGVLYDEEKTGQELLRQVQAGLLKPERYLAWYYKLPCDTEEQREHIRKEYMPEVKNRDADY